MDYINKFVDKIRVNLNRNIMRRAQVTAIMYGVILGLLVVALSLVVPIYREYVIIGALIPLAVSIPVGFFIGVKKRKSDKDAALYIDRFGFKEKIITALDNEKYKDPVCEMQRKDAEAHLRAEGFKVKVAFELPWGKLGVAIILAVLAVTLFFVPTPAKKRAADMKQAKLSSKEAEKEVEEMLEALEKIDQGELTPEELEELKQMMEALETSQQEFKSVSSMDQFNKAREKYDYKLGDMSDKLGQLSNGKTGNAEKSLKSAQELAENQNKTSNTQKASNKEDEGKEGQGEEGQGEEGQGEEGQGQQGQGEEGQGQQGQGEEGQGQQGQGEEGQGQQGQGEEGQGQQGQGEGQGQGQEESQGEGEGQGEGKSQGGDQGQGQGEGSGETAKSHNHDYVSVNENISGDYNDNSTSEYAHEQNGLAWEGTAVPYQDVVNDYSKQAYEGIDKGKYPGTMSDVIKNYFTGLSE